MLLKLARSLNGKKTYLLAVLGAVVVLLEYFKVIDPTLKDTLLGLFGAGAVASVRSALKS